MIIKIIMMHAFLFVDRIYNQNGELVASAFQQGVFRAKI